MLTPRPRHSGARTTVAQIKCSTCGRAVGTLVAATTLADATADDLDWRGTPACSCRLLSCYAHELGAALAKAQRHGRPTTWRLLPSQCREMTDSEQARAAADAEKRRQRHGFYGQARAATRNWTFEDWAAFTERLAPPEQ